MINPSSSSELCQIKSRFAKSFVKALLGINKPIIITSDDSLSSASARRRRRLRIKLAADRSMARAVRSRRVWRVAVLRRRRTTRRRPGEITRNNNNIGVGKEEAAEELRKVVPGGEEMMSMRVLVDEAAHYAQCLTLQVQVMTAILHHFRSNI